ncbi:hypothetical protein RI367_000562 [Sorochytrium milnesiophthora]
MANSSTKKIVASKERLLKRLWTAYFAINALHVLLLLFVLLANYDRRGDATDEETDVAVKSPLARAFSLAFARVKGVLYVWIATNVVALWLLRSLGSMGKGVVSTVMGELNVQVDLSAQGLHQYMLDVLYITYAIQVVSVLFTPKAAYLYMAIPMYGGWQLSKRFLMPALGMSSTIFSSSADADDDKAPSKTQLKKEKRQKVKYMRG